MASRKPRVAPAQDKLSALGIEAVCERIADCETLQSIADSAEVSKGTLITWLAGFPDHYARAREAQAEKLVEDILAIADTPMVGVKTKTNEKGEVETTEADMIEHRRLQVDARKWLAGKMAPKKYGDKVTQEHTGAGGGPILMEQIAANPRSRLTVK